MHEPIHRLPWSLSLLFLSWIHLKSYIWPSVYVCLCLPLLPYLSGGVNKLELVILLLVFQHVLYIYIYNKDGPAWFWCYPECAVCCPVSKYKFSISNMHSNTTIGVPVRALCLLCLIFLLESLWHSSMWECQCGTEKCKGLMSCHTKVSVQIAVDFPDWMFCAYICIDTHLVMITSFLYI